MRILSVPIIATSLIGGSAFHLPTTRTNRVVSTCDILSVRGGGDIESSTKLSSLMAPISDSLLSGSPIKSLGALYAVASMTVVPLTLYRQAYSFSVGK